MGRNHIDSSTRSTVLGVAKNPLTYVFLMFAATATERIGLSYDNPYAQKLSCGAAYFTTDRPLESPVCRTVLERLRPQP